MKSIKKATHESLPPYMLIRQYVLGIASRAENAGKRILSINELCKLFNVTHPTVIKALQELINEGILTATPGVGTFVNQRPLIPFGRSFHQFKHIGIITGQGKLVNYDRFHLRIISGIFDALGENGAIAQLINPTTLDAGFIKIIEAMHLDGIIWVNPNFEICAPCIEAIDKAGFPLVTTTQFPHEATSKNLVGYNMFQGGYLAAERLIKAGHRKILHICNNYGALGSNKKQAESIVSGLKNAYQTMGISIGEEYYLQGDETVFEKIELMMKVGFEFSAVFCEGNFFLPLHKFLQDNNLRVPEDVTVVTLDDAYSKFKKEKAIFIVPPTKEVGSKTVEVLLTLINGNTKKNIKEIINWSYSAE